VAVSELAYARSPFPIRDQQANEIPFLTGSRVRVKLPETDKGPRAVTGAGHSAIVANYFSDTLTAINLSEAKPILQSIPLGPKPAMSEARKGEFYFHDAGICLQGWQSCSSCHPDGARSDGMNWDLLNDGVGNPKNTRSLLFAHQTGAAMSLGVRKNAEDAVRAGIKYILFSDQPDEVARSIDTYLKSLAPVPSPRLKHGQLSSEAQRGKAVFKRAGCAVCHPPGVFTDSKLHDVGTQAASDKANDRFLTPTLVEVWRTSPYLHDGSAVTVREVITTHNPNNQHGKTSALSAKEIDVLCEYLLSL
jgi:cytochrome c peroxidase